MTAVGHAAIIVAERKALLARTESLVREFHPVLPAGTVIRAVTRCRTELLRAGVRRGLAGATEARVRAQLGRTTADVDRVWLGGDSPWPGLPPLTHESGGERRDQPTAPSRADGPRSRRDRPGRERGTRVGSRADGPLGGRWSR